MEKFSNKEELLNKVFEERFKSGKLMLLEKLLKDWLSEGLNKVLIFSQSLTVIEVIGKILSSIDAKYLKLVGATSPADRHDVIHNFTTDNSIFALILTTRVGGLGVNLMAANKVVIFDPDWNPSVDM